LALTHTYKERIADILMEGWRNYKIPVNDVDYFCAELEGLYLGEECGLPDVPGWLYSLADLFPYSILNDYLVYTKSIIGLKGSQRMVLFDLVNHRIFEYFPKFTLSEYYEFDLSSDCRTVTSS
jgi:hypothetical protein